MGQPSLQAAMIHARFARDKIINLLCWPYGLCFARINLSVESCFVLLLGYFLGDTLQQYYYALLTLLSKFSDQGNIPLSEKGR